MPNALSSLAFLLSDQDLLEDPGFVKNVCALMQDPHICSTFAVFDQDRSGSISTTELKEVVTMLQLASNKTDLETILEELDINKDGGIDLWEFCVYLQKTKDRRQLDESNWELDQAFQVLPPLPHSSSRASAFLPRGC